MTRGYWFLPKFLYGVPVTDLLAGNVPPQDSGPLAGETMEEIFEGALHFAGNTFSIFDHTVHVAAAHAKATLDGDRICAARLAQFDPDLQGDFAFLNTRRNANQVHIPALEATFNELQRDFRVQIPNFADHEFFAFSPDSVALGAHPPARPVPQLA